MGLDATVTMKHIVLKKGAPPLNQLHMELRVSTRMRLNLGNYSYNTEVDGPTPGMLIGRSVQTVLDSINEERLLYLEGDTSMEEILGVYDKTILEVGAEVETNGTHQLVSEYDTLRYEYVLADEAGTVWSQLIEVQEGPLVDVEKEDDPVKSEQPERKESPWDGVGDFLKPLG